MVIENGVKEYSEYLKNNASEVKSQSQIMREIMLDFFLEKKWKDSENTKGIRKNGEGTQTTNETQPTQQQLNEMAKEITKLQILVKRHFKFSEEVATKQYNKEEVGKMIHKVIEK